MAMVGESEQDKGRVGARRAKLWLERTTRVRADFVNPDAVAVRKLTVRKMQEKGNSKTFSFDLGGFLRGDNLEGQGFLAECKNYSKENDLPAHYRHFLAHCYRARFVDHLLAENFFWIAFSPHQASKWDRHVAVDSVKEAVLHVDERAVNFKEGADPDKEFDEEVARYVADNLWIIILSHKQIDHLILSSDHHGLIEAEMIRQAAVE